MYELLLAALTAAASGAAAMVLARGKPRVAAGRPSLEDGAGIAGIALALGLVAAALPRATFAQAASLAGSGLVGALVANGAPFLTPRADDLASRASAAIVEQALALLGLSLAVLGTAAATGALRDPQVLAPEVVVIAAGFGAGAQIGRSERAARTSAECVLAMVPLAMLFQRNALVLRAGPIATSAIGLFALPIAIRALGLIALGAAAMSSPKPSPRAAYVFASSMALAVLGASFVLAGVFWPSALFCGVAGVAAALGTWRAGARGATILSPFVAIAGAALASVAVAERTGLTHAHLFALPLFVVALAGSAEALDALEPDADAGFARGAGSFALAPVAVTAVASASAGAACARWAAAEQLPLTDRAVLLARCDAAHLSAQHVDLLHPSVAIGGAAGALLAWETQRDESLFAAPVRLAVAVAVVIGLRLAFGTGAPAMAALVAGALLVSFAHPARRRVAYTLAALSVAIAPLYA